MMLKVSRNDQCPCGSGQKAKRCCLKTNGVLEKLPANIIPDGPNSGFSHPKCFANADNNCSDTISHEHFVSETLLHQIEKDNTVKIAGSRWQTKEKFDIIPIPVLASKILCTRHNNALSALDAAIGYFSQTLQDYDDTTHPSVTLLQNEVRLFAGEDIERWMLKCLIGATYSKNFAQRSIKAECLDLLYGRIEWPSSWGLHIGMITPGQVVYHSDSFLIQTLTGGPNKLILMARFVLRGLPFNLVMGTPDSPKAMGIWRPSRLVFEAQKAEKVIEISWHVPASGQILSWNRSGAYNVPPPDWQEWERQG
jgi:hypothetical protein